MRRWPVVLVVLLGVWGCDSSSGEETTEADTATTAGTDGTESTDMVMTGPEYRFVEFRDNETAAMALVCEETNFPGADLDRARLFADPTRQELLASLTSCKWAEQTNQCATNFASSPSGLEGTFQSDGVSGFVSLNGGSVICELSDDQSIKLGMLLAVDEVGSDDTAVEPYEVRVCADADRQTCGPWEKAVKKDQTFPAGSLLPAQ